MKTLPISSRQPIGYTKQNLQHSRLSSYNLGKIYPIVWDEVDVGDTIHNNVDAFLRSSALSSPAFLDIDISVAHYFVPYNCIDPLYEIRCQRYKGSLEDSRTPRIAFGPNYVTSNTSSSSLDDLYPAFKPGSLMDHLGCQITKCSATPPGTPHYTSMNLYPILTYHSIVDEFYTNTRLQNSQYVRNWVLENLVPLGNNPQVAYSAISGGQRVEMEPQWVADKNATSKNFLALRRINFEPDYFTSATREKGGKDIALSTVSNVRELLDAELQQKVIDMLYNGGYSYNDYVRVILGVENINQEAHDPIFLGGSSGPLQVSTVTATGENLADQAATAAGGAGLDNSFTHTFTAAGVYMAVMFLRPATYYNKGVDVRLARLTLGDRLNPLLSDLSKSPITISEMSNDYKDFLLDRVTEADAKDIFGYKDRYEEYRTRYNTVHGEFRTTRENWYLPRVISDTEISSNFIQMTENNTSYAPWNITAHNIDHFFGRLYFDMYTVRRLPARPYPYAW